MLTVKVSFHDGDYFVTNINCTEDFARVYYRIGKLFNIGDGARDCLKRVVALEVL